jgi:hypothetical protein
VPSKKGRGFGCLAMVQSGSRMLPRFVPMICQEEDSRNIPQWKPPKGYKRKPRPKAVSTTTQAPFPQGMPPGLVFVPMMMPQHMMQTQVQQQQPRRKSKKQKQRREPAKPHWYTPPEQAKFVEFYHAPLPDDPVTGQRALVFEPEQRLLKIR